MMATVHIETADELIRVIGELWQAKSLKKLKAFLDSIPSEEEFYRLIRLADESDLYGYSNLLADWSYKRFGTLSSYAWHCARYAETGRSLEAEEKMLAKLQGIHAEEYTNGELMHAHHLLLKVYSILNRIPEAAEQLARIEELGGARPDQEAFFALYSGNWDQAESLLKAALPDTKSRWNAAVHLLYADLLSMRGAPERSLELLDRGAKRFPDIHAFSTERVTRFHQLGRFSDSLEEMKQVLARNPYHSRKTHFIHLTAHCLYELERFDELEDWIAAHPKELKESLYTKAQIDRQAGHRKLPLTQEVQKLNYCVPASLSLMLQAFGKPATQDDIAAHVFDVTGSKLQTTMNYMEKQGFTARYFKGTVDQYKAFIDRGVPVLLSMLIENSAHVQVVVGYDDRLQALVIQDPNDLGPYLIAYEEVPKAFRLTDSLSMAFEDGAHEDLLALLDPEQHRFFKELYELLDVEPLDEARFIRFLEQHENERYAAVVGLMMALPAQDAKQQEKWIDQLRTEFGKDDAEIALLAAHLHFQKDQGKKALEALKNVPHTRSPYALFLQAAISMNEGDTERAIPLLKRSIELDHYQPLAYSHLARCYLDAERIFQAYKWSNIAIDQLPEDVFAQITHGLIQYEYGALDQAHRRFQALHKKHPDDGYFVYEMGRCEQALGKTERALETYRKALALDSDQPYAYLRMAELYMADENWEEAAKIIEEGLAKDSRQDILHLYLGHIAIEQEQFGKAEAAYRRAHELDPEDLFAPVHIAHALYGQKHSDEALRLLKKGLEGADAGYRLRAADLIFEQAETPEAAGEALALIEDGLKTAQGGELRMLAERYAEFGASPSLLHRTIQGLKTLRDKNDPHILCLEAELHETAGNARFAKALYEASGKLPLALVKRAQLLETSGEFGAAIKLYEQAASIESSYAPALGGLVRCYRELEKPKKAFAAALDFLAAEPLSAVLPELADFAETQADIDKLHRVIDRIKEQVPAEWLYAARAHVRELSGEYEVAEKLFQRAGDEPNAFPSRFQYAQFLNRRGKHKRANAVLVELIKEAPEEADLYGEYLATNEALGKVPFMSRTLKKELPADALGTAYMLLAEHMMARLGELDAQEVRGLFGRLRSHSKRMLFASTIITLCETAGKLMPDSEDPALRLAQFYLDRDMAKEAAEELKPYKNIPGEAKRMALYIDLQYAHERGKPADFERLHEELEAYGQTEKQDGGTLVWWSEVLDVLERPKVALEKLEAAIALEPFNPELYTRKWHLLEAAFPERLEAFEAGLPEELQYAEWLILARASTHSTKGAGQMAKELLEPLVRDMPDFVPAQFELARAEAARHNPQGAKAVLKQLLETEDAAAIWEMAEDEDLLSPILAQLSSP